MDVNTRYYFYPRTHIHKRLNLPPRRTQTSASSPSIPSPNAHLNQKSKTAHQKTPSSPPPTTTTPSATANPSTATTTPTKPRAHQSTTSLQPSPSSPPSRRTPTATRPPVPPAGYNPAPASPESSSATTARTPSNFPAATSMPSPQKSTRDTSSPITIRSMSFVDERFRGVDGGERRRGGIIVGIVFGKGSLEGMERGVCRLMRRVSVMGRRS